MKSERQAGYEAGIEAAKAVVANALDISLMQPPGLPAHALARTQAGWITEELEHIKEEPMPIATLTTLRRGEGGDTFEATIRSTDVDELRFIGLLLAGDTTRYISVKLDQGGVERADIELVGNRAPKWS